MISENRRPPLKELRDAIADALSEEKAYNLPQVCSSMGLKDGDEREAFSSKFVYVNQRLVGKSEQFLIEVAKKTLREYPSEHLANVLANFVPHPYEISRTTRSNIVDELMLVNQQQGISLHGRLDFVTFLQRIWPLSDMPSTDPRHRTAAGDIQQHMVWNDDWDYHYLFHTYLELPSSQDKTFLRFLEEVVHPVVRDSDSQTYLVQLINARLVHDGFRLEASETIADIPVYRAVKIISGITSRVKNLIFAANGPKPEIILADSINNDIQIIKHQEYCLVYDLSIPETGLKWSDLMTWWAQKTNQSPVDKNTARSLYKRLRESLDSPPEKLLFKTYFEQFKDLLGNELPALIPQVYLHYDPYTLKQLEGNKRIPRQRMDFLLLFSNRDRVVIEVDGKQHYADGEAVSPKLYAEMVAADRKLRLAGYEIYRFGGYELQGNIGKQEVEQFFRVLFQKHRIIN